MKRCTVISTLSLIALLVSTTPAQKVSVDYDRNADFSRYRTYALLESKNPAGSRLWCERILDNIQLKLAVKGLLPARTGESVDLFIVYHAGIREQTAIEGYNYNYGPGWRWSWSDAHSQMYPVLEESDTLVIDLVDARRNRLVWRGVATDTLFEKSNKLKRVDKATERMFAKYPPNVK